jgi:hypothetical protein
MAQLFNELVELLEAIEKGGDLPPMGPAHQELVKLDEEDDQVTSSLS